MYYVWYVFVDYIVIIICMVVLDDYNTTGHRQ